MNKLVVLIIFIVTGFTAYSQSNWVEKEMTRRSLNCEDIFYNMTYLLPEYYRRSSMDSLRELMQYWEKSCGKSEVLVRCQILFAIDEQRFSENLYDIQICNYLIDYKDRKQYEDMATAWYYYGSFQTTIRKEFNVFTSVLAAQLMDRPNLSALELFFLGFYANRPEVNLKSLKSFIYSGTVLQNSYINTFDEINKSLTARFGFIAGAWIPERKLAAFGSHPVIGTFFGFQKNKSFMDLVLSLGMGKSANTIQVFKDDSLYLSNNFMQIFFGVKAGYEFVKEKNYRLSASAGIAYDGIDVLEIKDDDGKEVDSKTISSFNMNAGLTYTYVFKSFRFLAVDARYNLVNYANKGGTNVGGNYLQLSVLYGLAGNSYRDRRLTLLN